MSIKRMFCGYVSKIVSAWCSAFENLKGTKSYAKKVMLSPTEVKFITAQGITVTIRIITHRYEINYDISQRLKRVRVVYEVFGQLPEGVDEDVQVLYREPLYFPKLLNHRIHDDFQMRAVVDAFLDVKKTLVVQHIVT